MLKEPLRRIPRLGLFRKRTRVLKEVVFEYGGHRVQVEGHN